jgi:DNA-binding FadR family transcriptional regulator
VTVTTTTAVARRDKVKRAEQVAAVIRADIVANGWPVGRVLGAEPELMERYGVSRAVLREAVRIVEYLGVARMRQGPGGGLVVAAPNATAVTSAALVYFAYDRVKLEEVLGARRIIEEMAVELAATQATDAQLEHLRSSLAAANGRATERVEVWELHDVVAGLTGNPGIVLFVKIISRITALYGASGRRSAAKRRQERAATMTAHDRIVDAICARDATRARLAMRTHLEEIEGFLLSRRGRPPVTIGDPNRDFPGTKLGGQIAMHILTDIVDRGWPVGELLGSEAKLMAQHEASRAVIREAIRLLEFHQVVTTRRHGRAPGLPGHRSPAAVRGALRPRGRHRRRGRHVVRRPAGRAARGDAGRRAGGPDRGRRPGQPRLARDDRRADRQPGGAAVHPGAHPADRGARRRAQ